MKPGESYCIHKILELDQKLCYYRKNPPMFLPDPKIDLLIESQKRYETILHIGPLFSSTWIKFNHEPTN